MAASQSGKRKVEGFRPLPWVLFLLLALTVYLFWILPMQQGPRPVRVEFAEDLPKR